MSALRWLRCVNTLLRLTGWFRDFTFQLTKLTMHPEIIPELPELAIRSHAGQYSINTP